MTQKRVVKHMFESFYSPFKKKSSPTLVQKNWHPEGACPPIIYRRTLLMQWRGAEPS